MDHIENQIIRGNTDRQQGGLISLLTKIREGYTYRCTDTNRNKERQTIR
jgi:hypothetical protein